MQDFQIRTENGMTTVKGRYVSQTRKALCAVMIQNIGGGYYYSLTHVPTGLALQGKLQSLDHAEKCGRAFWRQLSKPVRESFLTEQPNTSGAIMDGAVESMRRKKSKLSGKVYLPGPLAKKLSRFTANEQPNR